MRPATPPTLAYAQGNEPVLLARALKRCMDTALATAMLIALALPMVLIAFAVAVTNGGGFLYCQTRVGQRGRLFLCLKFRTMRHGHEAWFDPWLADNPKAEAEWRQRQKLTDDPRVTPLGRFLRRWGLDELPQLINVVCGDMALVGPRPILPEEQHRYGNALDHYHAVRPGITGLWQVQRNLNTTYLDRIHMDVVYAHSWSLALDMRLIIKTPAAVLRQSRQGLQ